MNQMAKFFSNVVIVLDDDACWEWQAGCNSNGYGMMRFNGQPQGCHRIAWQIEHGPVPEGLHVLHTCDNRRCVNPDHLFLGTHQENMNDMLNKGRFGYNYPPSSNNPDPRTVLSKRNHRALTDDEIKTIINDPRSIRAIAREYGVSHSTISHYKTGRRRKQSR